MRITQKGQTLGVECGVDRTTDSPSTVIGVLGHCFGESSAQPHKTVVNGGLTIQAFIFVEDTIFV